MIGLQRRLLIAALSLVLFRCPTAQPSPAGVQEWQEEKTAEFIVRYKSPDKAQVAPVLALCHSAASSLSLHLNQPPPRAPITIFIADSQESLDQLTGGTIPHWGEGVANPLQNRIVIKSPNLSQNSTRLGKLLHHELAHIYIGRLSLSPASLPRWFSEGMAVLLSSDEAFSGERLSKAMMSDSVIPLDEIEQMLAFPDGKARLAYEQSYAFTLYLKEEFGMSALLEMAKKAGPEQPFEATFLQVTGADLWDVEQEWFDYLGSKYRWHFLLDFETYLWLLILLLFIVGVMAVRLRNRRTIRRWEEEERSGIH